MNLSCLSHRDGVSSVSLSLERYALAQSLVVHEILTSIVHMVVCLFPIPTPSSTTTTTTTTLYIHNHPFSFSSRSRMAVCFVPPAAGTGAVDRATHMLVSSFVTRPNGPRKCTIHSIHCGLVVRPCLWTFPYRSHS